jgi:putative membrane-bound dehydrogenase-like protein
MLGTRHERTQKGDPTPEVKRARRFVWNSRVQRRVPRHAAVAAATFRRKRLPEIRLAILRRQRTRTRRSPSPPVHVPNPGPLPLETGCSASGPVPPRGRQGRRTARDLTRRWRTTTGRIRLAWLAGLACGLALGCAAFGASPPPLAPEQALASFRIDRGLRIELVAAEPLVVDPVAFAFDQRGRLYVVEARGYPDVANRPTREGRVALLEDLNQDGKYDRRLEFAGGFTHPNGIAVWRGGVLLTCAPEIYYLKDHDGDGVADQRTVVLTGFQTGASAQNYASHPTLGLDGRIHVTCGLRSGGTVTSPLHPERAAIAFPPMDGRFDPDSFAYETSGGRSQFGLTFDAFGRRFVCDNRNPVMQVMLEAEHLGRNPHLQFAETMQAVSKVQGEAKVLRISRAAVTADFIPTLLSAPHAGTFTSACGLVVFGGSGLPPTYDGNLFICEPAQNLIQRQTLRPHGASFRSEPVFEDGAEFLSSTDVAFRPVFLASGPQGALYIADMHRAEIDHPTFIPEEVRGRLDFDSGKGAGRIYRVTGGSPRVAWKRPRFDSVTDLLGALESADAWSRETARRLMIERADAAALPRLKALATSSARAETRCSALWLLRSLDGLSPEIITLALDDSDPRVREQGVILAATQLGRLPMLGDRLVAMAADPDARVRFLLGLNLGAVQSAGTVHALGTLALRDAEDRWTRAAVLSGIGARATEFAEALIAGASRNPAAAGLLIREACRVVGAGATLAEGRRLLARARSASPDSPWLVAVALGLAEGAATREELRGAGHDRLTAFVALNDDPDGGIEALLRRAGKLAQEEGAAIQDRANAVALLGYGDFERSSAVLGDLLDLRQPGGLRLEAVRSLERIGDVRGAELLARPEHWSGYSIPLRSAVVSALSTRPGWPEVLIAAVERGTVRPAEIPYLQRNYLLRRSPPDVRRKAAAVFETRTHDRMEVYRNYLEVLKLDAAAERGEAVFLRSCAACHTYESKGGAIGPDLTGIRHQPREAILLHTLVPNREIAPNYESVTLATRSGASYSGRILAETEGSLTLRTVGGTDENVLRSAIASMQRPGVSLMPDGLEDTMTRLELADLIAYLKAGAE